MKKMICAMLAALMAMTGAWAMAEAAALPAALQAEITVQGSGTISTQPDMVTATVNAAVTAPTILEAQTQVSDIVARTTAGLLELGFSPKEATRGGNFLLYFKKADIIADFFTSIGASNTALGVMMAKIEKEMRNDITRKVNCDSANVDKIIVAAQEQMEAIRYIVREFGLDALPEPLRDAALLRIANPEASLADLAVLSNPKVTKSCLSHRLRKIMSLAAQARAQKDFTEE